MEDWSNGIATSPEHVFLIVEALKEKVERFMLADTLGVLNPEQTYNYLRMMIEKYPRLHFDFHAHNDL